MNKFKIFPFVLKSTVALGILTDIAAGQTVPVSKAGLSGGSSTEAILGANIDWTIKIDNRNMSGAIDFRQSTTLQRIRLVDLISDAHEYVADSFEVPWDFTIIDDDGSSATGLNNVKAETDFLSPDGAFKTLEFASGITTVSDISNLGGGDGWGVEFAEINGVDYIVWLNHHCPDGKCPVAQLQCVSPTTQDTNGDPLTCPGHLKDIAEIVGPGATTSDASDVSIYDNTYAYFAYGISDTEDGFGCWNIASNTACNVGKHAISDNNGKDKPAWVDTDLDISASGRAFSGNDDGDLYCWRANTGAACGDQPFYSNGSNTTFSGKEGPTGILDDDNNRYYYYDPRGQLNCVNVGGNGAQNGSQCSAWNPPSIDLPDNKYAPFFTRNTAGAVNAVCFLDNKDISCFDEVTGATVNTGSGYLFDSLDKPTSGSYIARTNRLYVGQKGNPVSACWDFNQAGNGYGAQCNPVLDLSGVDSYYALGVSDNIGCGFYNTHVGVIGSFDLITHEIPCVNTRVTAEVSANALENFCRSGLAGIANTKWNNVSFAQFDSADFSDFSLRVTDSSDSTLATYTFSGGALQSADNIAVYDIPNDGEIYFKVSGFLAEGVSNPFDPTATNLPSVTVDFINQRELEACLSTFVTEASCSPATVATNYTKLRYIAPNEPQIIYGDDTAVLNTIEANAQPCGIDLQLSKSLYENKTLAAICTVNNTSDDPRDTAMNCDASSGEPLPGIAYCDDEVTYRINVENLGPAVATNIEVTDYLPDNFEYVQSAVDPNVAQTTYTAGPQAPLGGTLSLDWTPGQSLGVGSVVNWDVTGYARCN
ncbi:MAG: hypothetical protein ACPG40_01430 [Alphaproteobacteria bacterium]